MFRKVIFVYRLSRLIRVKTFMEVQALCDGFYPSVTSPEGYTEYYFDQNPENFNSILDIYRIGKLHRTKNTCALTYVKYLEYWGFHEVFLESCCAIEYYAEKSFGENEQESEKLALKRRRQRLKDENFGKSFLGRIRKYLWDFTEYPEKSMEARVYQITLNIELYYAISVQ